MVYDNDPDWVFEKGGIRAAEEARKQGKVRYIGFTGHKDPRIHLKMLGKDFPWDASLMPVNVMGAHYRSFQNEVIPVCLEKDVAVLGMKSLGGGGPRAFIPSGTSLSAVDCRRYALAQPVASLVVGIQSMEDLEQDLAWPGGRHGLLLVAVVVGTVADHALHRVGEMVELLHASNLVRRRGARVSRRPGPRRVIDSG